DRRRPRRRERRHPGAQGLVAPPVASDRAGRRRSDPQVRDRERDHSAARAGPDVRPAAPRGDQSLQGLADGGADLRPRLRELSFASYLLMKIVGPEHGIGLTGLLGGLVSSTAVTLGFSQRSRQHANQAPALAFGILLAWTVMFVRVVALVAAVER